MSTADFLQSLPWPVLHHWWYWAIFFAAVLEAFPLLWSFVPGHTLVIFWGFLAKLGVLNLWSVLLVSSFWAILWDYLGYWLGRRYGNDLTLKYGKYFFFKVKYFEKTKKLMARHTGKTIVVGRFNTVTRAFVPFIAGSSGLGFARFSLYNVIGWLSWAVSSVLIGYVFWQSYEVAAKYFGRVVLIAIVVSIAFIVLYRFINKRKHIFLKYDPYLLALNIGSLYLFSKMLEDVLDSEIVTKGDVWVHLHMMLLWEGPLTGAMTFITNVGNASVLITLSVLLFGFLIYRKRWHYCLVVLLSMVGGWMLEMLIKVLVQRPRPEMALIAIPGSYSFPSGHATMATIFFSLLIYIFREGVGNRWLGILFVIANVCAFLLIGFSRIYLGVHWMSDVLAGCGLGLFWLTLVILGWKIANSFLQERRKPKPF